MKHLLLILLFLATSIVSHGQDTVVVKVIVVDDIHSDPIPNVRAKIQFDDTLLQERTSTKGSFYFECLQGTDVKFELSHYKFENKNFRKRIHPKAIDTVEFTFKMKFIREQWVDEMVVTAPGVPTRVYGSKKWHVSDFEILNNGDLLMLTYPKQLKKGSSLVLWDGRKVKSSFEVDERSEDLVRDFRGNPHLVCENSVLGIYVNDKEVGLAKLEKDYFMKYVAPIVDTNKTKMYFSNFNAYYPAFDYYSFDQLDSAYRKILEIEDELMMELYRSEYKWVDVRTKLWAKNKELETGIDAEIWVGMNYFTQSIYYKELYAPMFHRNDSLFVFDYYKDYLRVFDEVGEKLDSIPIYHHYDKRHTGWESELIQDRATGQIYAIFDRAGYTYLGYVNTTTGEITEHVKLEYRYAHHIQVYNNHVFYVYRPFESAQKKYLYKERLPYDFGAADVYEGELVNAEEE